MTLNEKKIKKGIAMNKFRSMRNNIGNVSYQQNRKPNLLEEYNINFSDYEPEEPKKSKKKEKQIKIEKKKDIMSDILEPIEPTKKKIIIQEVESKESDDKQTGGGINENKSMKKLFITADLKPDAKKNELIL